MRSVDAAKFRFDARVTAGRRWVDRGCRSQMLYLLAVLLLLLTLQLDRSIAVARFDGVNRA